jgi:hypothetical protein
MPALRWPKFADVGPRHSDESADTGPAEVRNFGHKGDVRVIGAGRA